MEKVKISLARPDVSEQDIAAVVEALRSGRLSCGPKLEVFERDIAAFVGSKHAVGLSSGTAALHLCLLALGVGPGAEVITSPFSFVASANCILYAGARPVFVDIDEKTLNIDASKIEAAITPQTRAILPVHVFGRPCEIGQIMAIAERHRLIVLEDSCEALGARVNGQSAGTFGRAGVFAFYANKQITTGEGGMIVTDDDELARVCRSLRNQGRGDSAEWLEHPRLGYNFRMTEMQGAMGSSQLRRLGEFMQGRADVAARYAELLSDCEEVILPTAYPSNITPSWFVYVVQLRDEFTEEDRNAVIQKLREEGIECSTYFPAIHLQKYFRDKYGYRKGDFPVTERVSERTLALPFHPRLSAADAERVTSTLKAALSTLPARYSAAR